MHRCLHCQYTFDAASHTAPCPSCGTALATCIGGVPCYSPQLAYESPGFQPEHFARLAEVESGNFWFRARNELIIHTLQEYFPQARNMLEIGCGTGYVLHGVTRALPNLHVSGSEIFLEGLSFASHRLPGADLFQMDARQIPFKSEFDLVGAFDVVEHIKEDEQVLDQIRQALKPGGGAIFTVPQHPALWSAQDERACHVRRYRRHELANKLENAGFKILFSSSFVSLLLPLLAASRLRKRHPGKEADANGEFMLPAPINSTLYAILHLEVMLIRLGLRFPIGGTRLVAAVKAD